MFSFSSIFKKVKEIKNFLSRIFFEIPQIKKIQNFLHFSFVQTVTMGRTALHDCAVKGDSETLQQLLSSSHSFNVNEQDEYGVLSIDFQVKEKLRDEKGSRT